MFSFLCLAISFVFFSTCYRYLLLFLRETFLLPRRTTLPAIPSRGCFISLRCAFFYNPHSLYDHWLNYEKKKMQAYLHHVAMGSDRLFPIESNRNLESSKIAMKSHEVAIYESELHLQFTELRRMCYFEKLSYNKCVVSSQLSFTP